jgi:8-oxo-dGTP diphosphatase
MKAEVVPVAVGVIRNPQGEILIARRPDNVHQGARWEFPGGKIEAGESVLQALQRELQEELGIEVERSRPLIRIRHDYPDKSVQLDVHEVLACRGEPHGREQQPVQWVAPCDLSRFEFPAANLPILRALTLPAWYLITGDFDGEARGLEKLQRALYQGIRLVQLRAKQLTARQFESFAIKAIALCHARGARIMLNASPELACRLGADGVHLASARLMALSQRPADPQLLVSASVHDATQLAQANRLAVDFSVISPLFATASHPDAALLGWQGFRRLAEQAVHPVYALGGMQTSMLAEVWQRGGQGIAAISSLWGRA